MSRSPNRTALCRAALASLALCCLLSAARGQVVRHNPVIPGDHPDPTVLRVGGEYWAMVTTGDWAPHFTILRSPDLVAWRTVGAVFQKKPAWAKGDFWAPELSQDRGTFYLYYTARRDEGPAKKGTLCVAVATAPAPEGPYTDHGPVVCQPIGSIDPFSLRDADGRRYLIWKEDGNDQRQPTPIWAQQLTEDGLRLTGKRKELIRNDAATWEGIAVEGPYVLRRGGWYYLFYSGNSCCGRACNYALGVARARTLLGTWQKDPANPIVGGNSAWQCPGHGDVVSAADGREFLLYHAYRRSPDAFMIGREAVLDRLTWDGKGWPHVNDDAGPGGDAPAPSDAGGAGARTVDQAKTRTVDPMKLGAADFFDGFNSPQLDAAWQWPMRNAQSARVDAASGGYLLLTTEVGGAADGWAGAVVGVRAASGSYAATVALVPPTAPGARAGLSAYAWREASLGVAVGDGKVSVWRREGGSQETLASADAPRAPLVFLRMTAERGEAYRFEFSANGRDWQPLGGDVNGSYIEGAHVALTAAGPPGSAARFDWIRIAPRAGVVK